MPDTPTPTPMTPIEALMWLSKKALNIKFGRNHYTLIADYIRELIKERCALSHKIDSLELEIARLQKLKTPTRFGGTEGNAQWDSVV